MAKGNINSKKGFTIIEVVLVLAIAGLIFLMVFIALPALQRGQRNTQREDDLARMLTAVTDYQSNNSGRTPFGTTGAIALNSNFVTRYIDDGCAQAAFGGEGTATCTGNGDQFTDPDGTVYSFDNGTVATTANGDGSFNVTLGDGSFNHTIYAVVGHVCGVDEGTARVGTGDRQIALFMTLEGGGITCNDNQ